MPRSFCSLALFALVFHKLSLSAILRLVLSSKHPPCQTGQGRQPHLHGVGTWSQTNTPSCGQQAHGSPCASGNHCSLISCLFLGGPMYISKARLQPRNSFFDTCPHQRLLERSPQHRHPRSRDGYNAGQPPQKSGSILKSSDRNDRVG